jgi:hypothetical protein
VGSFALRRLLLKAIGAVAAARLAAPAAAKMIGLCEDYVWAVVVELAWLGDRSDSIVGIWNGRSHVSIFADSRAGEMGVPWRLLIGQCKGLVGVGYDPLLGVLDLGRIWIGGLPCA